MSPAACPKQILPSHHPRIRVWLFAVILWIPPSCLFSALQENAEARKAYDRAAANYAKWDSIFNSQNQIVLLTEDRYAEQKKALAELEWRYNHPGMASAGLNKILQDKILAPQMAAVRLEMDKTRKSIVSATAIRGDIGKSRQNAEAALSQAQDALIHPQPQTPNPKPPTATPTPTCLGRQSHLPRGSTGRGCKICDGS